MVRSSARDSLFAPGVLEMQPSKLHDSEYKLNNISENLPHLWCCVIITLAALDERGRGGISYEG